MDAPLNTLSFRDTLIIEVTKSLLNQGYNILTIGFDVEKVVDAIMAVRDAGVKSRYGKKND